MSIVYLIFIFLSPLISISGSQHFVSEDFQLYNLVIKSEISNKTRSITIQKSLDIDTAEIGWISNALKSGDSLQMAQIWFMTRDSLNKPVYAVDETTKNLISSFINQPLNSGISDNYFDAGIKVFLIDDFRFSADIQKSWKYFYKKYPHSGGLFQFSNICYTDDGKEAIFYYSVARNGLSAHGSLAIFINVNGDWKLKYKILVWQA